MLDQLGNGLLLGSIIAVSAVGLSLIFAVGNLVNFAHGDLVTFGATVAVLLSTGDIGLPVWLALLLAVVAGAVAGFVLDLAVFRPLRHHGVGAVAMLVVTLGLALVFRYGLLAWVGPGSSALPLPSQRVQSFLGLQLTPIALGVVLASIAILLCVGAFLLRSSTGTAMRAVANNRALAAASGIDVDRVMSTTWSLGVALAAVGGVMMALTQLVYWDSGALILLLLFAAVILGGVGTTFGAMAGGYIIGITTQLSVALPVVRDHNDLKVAVALGLMILILLVRPQGLLGRKARVS